MRQTLVIVVLGLVGLTAAFQRAAQLEKYPRPATQQEERARSNAVHQTQTLASIHQGRDSWYEFALRQFNPGNFDYGAWMEIRRQALLTESLRNRYFEYSASVTLMLAVLIAVCAKQWIDHRRSLWITAEILADLYNHDLYSRDVAEKAIRKYNSHMERCNRTTEMDQPGAGVQDSDSDQSLWRVKLEQLTEERDRYLRERDAAQTELDLSRRTLLELSVRLVNLAAKPGTTVKSATEPNSDLATVVQHINNLQEQIYTQRKGRKQVKRT